MSRRLDEMPEMGRVVIGTHDQEHFVRGIAEKEGTDYLLCSYVPLGEAFILNLDALHAHTPWCIEHPEP